MMSQAQLKVFLLIVLIALLAACTTPATATQAIPIATATQVPPPTPTLRPTETGVPTTTSIPGFEDWSVLNSNAVDIQIDHSSIILTLKSQVLWFMNKRGVLVYKMVNGIFKITADVHTVKGSDPSQPPGGDGSVQLGGLMTRNGDGGKENYVFIVVGDDGNGLSVETKTTLNSESQYNGPAWDSSKAELRICRFGQIFNLYKRPVNANEAWLLAESFDRPDLPEALQVGVNIYTNSDPDVQIRFDKLKIEPIAVQSDCETD